MQKYYYVVIKRTVHTHDGEVEIFQRHAVKASSMDEAVKVVEGYMDTFWDDTGISGERNKLYPQLAEYYSPGELDFAGEYAQVSKITEKTFGEILTEIMLP